MKRKLTSMWKVAPIILMLAASQSFADGGGNHGGSDGSHKLFSDWCDSVGSVLKQAKIDADMAVNMQSDYATAINDLTQGMKDALAKKDEQAAKTDGQYDPKDSFTYRLLKNGVQISKALSEEGEKANRDQVIVLEAYYKMIAKATNDLDVFSDENSFKEGPGSHERFEALEYVQFTKNELHWLLKSFTEKSSNVDTGSLFIPTIEDNDFLIIARDMLVIAKMSLSHVTVVGRYDQEKEDLKNLSDRISKYLDGDKGQLANPNYGLNHIIIPGIQSVIDRLPGQCDEAYFN